jgi:hypothetical protein
MLAVPSTQNLGEIVSGLAHQLKSGSPYGAAHLERDIRPNPNVASPASLEPPLWKPAE